MAGRENRAKPKSKQAADNPRPKDMAEHDRWSEINALAGEVATLAEVYPLLEIDYGRKRQMGDIVAIVGEKCDRLSELIRRAQTLHRRSQAL